MVLWLKRFFFVLLLCRFEVDVESYEEHCKNEAEQFSKSQRTYFLGAMQGKQVECRKDWIPETETRSWSTLQQ